MFVDSICSHWILANPNTLSHLNFTLQYKRLSPKCSMLILASPTCYLGDPAAADVGQSGSQLCLWPSELEKRRINHEPNLKFFLLKEFLQFFSVFGFWCSFISFSNSADNLPVTQLDLQWPNRHIRNLQKVCIYKLHQHL